jgi:hypothetical protein
MLHGQWTTDVSCFSQKSYILFVPVCRRTSIMNQIKSINHESNQFFQTKSLLIPNELRSDKYFAYFEQYIRKLFIRKYSSYIRCCYCVIQYVYSLGQVALSLEQTWCKISAICPNAMSYTYHQRYVYSYDFRQNYTLHPSSKMKKKRSENQ